MKLLFRLSIFIIITLAAESVLAQNISSIIDEAPNQEAIWSVTVRGENGEILESHNSDKTIIPASNQKLMTSAAILDHFGSDYRFTTTIYGNGELQGNTWFGDLIIKGSGDPTISGDLYEGDRYYAFRLGLV